MLTIFVGFKLQLDQNREKRLKTQCSINNFEIILFKKSKRL